MIASKTGDDGTLGSLLRNLRVSREAEAFVAPRFVRRAQYLTIEDVAGLLGVSARWYAALEAGERRPSQRLLERFADVLQLSDDERLSLYRRVRNLETNRLDSMLAFAPVRRAMRSLDVATDVSEACDVLERAVREIADNPLLTFRAEITKVGWTTVYTPSKGDASPFVLGPDDGVQCLPLPLGSVASVAELHTFGPEFDELYAASYPARSWYGVRLLLGDEQTFVGALRRDFGEPSVVEETATSLLARSLMWSFAR